MSETKKKPGRVEVEAIYPLTPMQQGMLFHSVSNPESKVYLEQFHLEISGELDIVLLEQAWNKVVDHYATLRGVFVWKKRKQPLHVIRKKGRAPWQNLDWRDMDSGRHSSALEEWLEQDKKAYVDLEKGPLLRFALIRLEDQLYHFILTAHHITGDGWSSTTIVQKAWEIYRALNEGKPEPVITPCIYRQYINWLQQQSQQAAEHYWRETLGDFTTPTPLVVDKQVSGSTTGHTSLDRYLTEEETTALQAFARQQGFTLSTLLQASWALLLSRYSGHDDVMFGVTVSGRPPELPSVETMVGLFLNTLPARVKLPKDDSILFWLHSLQEQHQERDQYAYSALVDIKNWSGVEQDKPLFDSFLVVENQPLEAASDSIPSTLQIRDLSVSGHADYPLTVLVFPGDCLKFSFIYAKTCFAESTVNRMISHFRTLLMGLVDDPDTTVDQLPLLTVDEEQQLLNTWNATDALQPLEQCVHTLVEAQVEKTPDAIAVFFDGQTLSYQALNKRANQLAHYLRDLGVGAATPVGFCLERSLDAAVVILGILKAGGVCTPLDPAYPDDRLTYMLNNTRAPVLLTQEKWRSRLTSAVPHQVVVLEKAHTDIAAYSDKNPSWIVGYKSAAYLVHTSGSTGKPKGIEVPHRSITNLVEHHIEYMPDSGVNMLQFASLSFDVSYHEIFAAWCLGGTLYMLTDDTRLDLSRFMGLLEKHPVHKMILPVTFLQQLSDAYGQHPERFGQVRAVISAGEQLQIPASMRDLFRQLPDCRLHNFYGPTEADLVTAYTFDADPDCWPDYPPIGKAAANVKVFLLDEKMRLVPVGVPGHLHVAGAGLACGYFGQSQMTAAKFIENPFSDIPGDRLYKTGDMARYMPDGNIEFLGRIDDAVKIRGNRVELGEVEAVLNSHPDVTAAVVSVHGSDSRNRYLAAYYTQAPEQDVQVADLRRLVQQKLPGYMMPAAFMPLEHLPLTTNGKVNRSVLPEPEQLRPVSEEAFIAPRTATEEVVADIWSEILKVDHIGIRDSFFTLGGNSLRAIQVVSRLQEIFSDDYNVQHLFEQPSIERTVRVLEELTGGAAVMEEIAQTVQAIAGMSPEEIQSMLASA